MGFVVAARKRLTRCFHCSEVDDLLKSKAIAWLDFFKRAQTVIELSGFFLIVHSICLATGQPLGVIRTLSNF